MPTLLWEHTCCGEVYWSGRAPCDKCGQTAGRSAWTLSMDEGMARYQLQYGLEPVGPHRPLADALIGQGERKCGPCDGRGVVADPGPSGWAVCPSCRGYGGGFLPNSPELVAIRARVVAEYPDAAVAGAEAAGADSFMSLLLRPAASSRAAFPPLPPEVIATLPPESLEHERICATPDSWEGLDTGVLQDVLWHALVIYGLTEDAARVEPLRDLYELAATRLSAAERTVVVSRLAAFVEDSGREGRMVSAAAFFPAIQLDMDGRVVSTAALSAAVLMACESNDALTGPKSIQAAALEMTDQQRRAWILSGLIVLGDTGTLTLLRGCWTTVDEEYRDTLSFAAGWLPYMSIVDFLITWAEDAVAAGNETEMARALGALGRVAAVAKGEVSTPQSGQGVHVLYRRFPAWAHPADDVISLERSLTVEQVARIIAPRLHALARREKEAPSMAAAVLRLWGQ